MGMLKSALWVLSEKTIRLFSAIIVSSLLARYLKPEGFGILNFYLAILSMLFVLSSLGLNRIIIREIIYSKTKKEKASVIKTAFLMRLFVSCLIFFIVFAFSDFLFSDYVSRYSYIIFICVIFNAFEIFDFYQQGVLDFKKACVARLIALFLSTFLKLIFVFLKFSLVCFFAAILVEYIFLAVLMYKFCARDGRGSLLWSGKFNMVQVKGFLSESWPEIIAGFSAILFLKMDQVMLFYLSSETEVGIYSAAARLSEAWYFLPSAIVAATFPKLIKLKDSGNERYLIGVKYLMSFMICMALIVAVMVSLFGGFAISLIFGDAYKGSSTVLSIHIWSSVFLCVGLVSGSWLVAEKKLRLNLYRNLFGLVINFIFNIFLIPRYGAIGASWSMVFGLASAYLLFNLFCVNLRWIFFDFFFTPFRVIDKKFLIFLKNNISRYE